jgi:hypothetical protein
MLNSIQGRYSTTRRRIVRFTHWRGEGQEPKILIAVQEAPGEIAINCKTGGVCWV